MSIRFTFNEKSRACLDFIPDGLIKVIDDFEPSYFLQRQNYLSELDRQYNLNKLVSQYDVDFDVAISRLFHIRKSLEDNNKNLGEYFYRSESIVRLHNFLRANYSLKCKPLWSGWY